MESKHENNDWHFVEEHGQGLEPASQNPRPSSDASDISESNQHFLKASVYGELQTNKIDSPSSAELPVSEQNPPEHPEDIAANSSSDQQPTDEDTGSPASDLPAPETQTEQRPRCLRDLYFDGLDTTATDTTTSPRGFPAALFAALISIYCISACLRSLKPSSPGASVAVAPVVSGDPALPLHLPPMMAPMSAPYQRALPEGNAEKVEAEFERRLERLELESLTAMQRLNNHDARLTSLEVQVAQLTEILNAQSSCNARFAKNGTPPSALQQGPLKKSLEARVHLMKQNAEGKVVPGRHQCENEPTAPSCGLPKELVEATPRWPEESKKTDKKKGGKGREKNRKSKGRFDDGVEYKVQLEVDELFKRVAALEGGVEALHSILSSLTDDVDEELAMLAASVYGLQGRVEELEEGPGRRDWTPADKPHFDDGAAAGAA